MVVLYLNKETRCVSSKDSDYSPRLSKIQIPDNSVANGKYTRLMMSNHNERMYLF